MNDVPHNDDASDDIDDLYRRGAAQDPSRPSPHVRQAILQQAAQLAAQRAPERPSPPHQAKKYFPPRRWALLGTLAAAVLAGLVVAPQFLLTPQSTTRKEPAEIARIEAPAPSPPRAESLQSYVPPSLEEIAPPPPPKVAMKSAAPMDRSKAVAKAPARAQTDALESITVTAALAASAPPKATSAPVPRTPAPALPAAAPAQAPTGTTTLVNTQSADGVIGGVPQDRPYVVTGAPDSPLTGAAVRRAAEQGDIAKLQYLLDRGADINARDADNRSPLMLAVIHSRAKVVELLLAHGADANAADRNGITPLQAAETSRQTAVAAALRAAGAH